MKKFINILLVVLLLTCVSCKAQPAPEQPIKDLETGLFCGPSSYSFEPFFVEDFIFDTVDNVFVIEYSDEGIDGETDYGYVQIETDQEDFFDILEYYACSDNYNWVNSYYIEEIFTPVEGGINIRYFLRKKE